MLFLFYMSLPLVFFHAGIPHQVGILSCKCEPFSVTLSRLRLWPTSSKQPSYALAFDLLDWMEAMLLECQVSLNDFCKALNYKLPAYVVVSKKSTQSAIRNSNYVTVFMQGQLYF